MKSRYNFLSLLFLFCASLMAQSQNNVRVISSDKLEEAKVIVVKDDYVLLNNVQNVQNVQPVIVQKFRTQQDPCRVFIGVGTIRDAETGGLKVDYTVDNTPATQYGVQEGDVILALDGVRVGTQSELEQERDKHQQGEAFSLDIVRNGEKMTINARFKECTAEEKAEAEVQKENWEKMVNDMQFFPRQMEGLQNPRMKERSILGIYKNEEAEIADGVLVKEIIPGKGAEAAGLKSGDVIKVVDGKVMKAEGSLSEALASHKPGEKVTVVYIRDGQAGETVVTLSGDQRFVSFNNEERDPCKVFIGVYTTDFANQGTGVRVSGVIDNTPAKESAVQTGDIILALDGQPVKTNQELTIERDKHKPGDQFTLTIQREGVQMNIDAIFKECPKDKETTLSIPAEQPLTERDNLQAPPTDGTDFALQLESFDAFPSPTLGPVNVRFEAKAAPTTVRITDVKGKMVYENQLNQFSGNFNEQVNLEGKSPGVYTITVQQDGKVFSKKIMLLSRV